LDNGLPPGYSASLVDTSFLGTRKAFDQATFSMMELRRNWNILRQLIAMIRAENPHIIHLNCSLSPKGVFRDLICSMISKQFRCKLIVHYRGNVPDFPSKGVKTIAYWALLLLAKMANINLVLNQPSLAFFSSRTVHNSEILPNFIEDHIYNLIATGSEEKNHKQVVYVGAVTAGKGAKEIIEIAGMLPEVEFLCIGAVKDDVLELVNMASNNIVFSGSKGPDQVFNALAGSDLFLFPSYTEGFPNAVLEAMSAGLPVVGTKVGAIPEMVDDTVGGMLFEIGEKELMAEAIQQLMKDDNLRYRMGAHNREKAKQYLYSLVINRLTEIYNRF
jgi:glycosyltransferase involved in cell wall biosynthesis